MEDKNKFELSKETLATLTDAELDQANGAWQGGFLSIWGSICDGGGSHSIICIRF